MDSKGYKLIVVGYLSCLLAGCGTGQVKSYQTLDVSTPGSIEIAIETEDDSLQIDVIKQQVGKNLADWDYPISAINNKPASHQLTALVGKVEYGSTPAGFSFSVGNSDPRALDFQKANVLPITCKLNPIKQPQQSAELNMGFADSAITRANPDEKSLIDHVSTVCFNLLRELNWPIAKTADKPEAKANSWIPEIRIETQEENSTDSPTTAPSHTSAVESKPATTLDNNAPKATPAPEIESAKSGPITKEITKEGRKVFIIHNQGNPITFKFGHERK